MTPRFQFRSAALAIMLGAALSGCASNEATKKEAAQIEDTQAFADRLIADKLAVAADAQREYVALVNEDQAVMAHRQKSLETDEVDVDYLGKPQELLQVFAHRYGYRFVESGRYRVLRNINVRMVKTPPIEVLRNVGYQITAAADVQLDKTHHVLRLIYKNKAIRQGPRRGDNGPLQ